METQVDRSHSGYDTAVDVSIPHASCIQQKNPYKVHQRCQKLSAQHLGHQSSHQKKTRPPKGLCDSSFTSPTNGKLKTQRSSSVTGAPATCWAAKRVPSGSAHSLSDPTSLATSGFFFGAVKGKMEKMEDFLDPRLFWGNIRKNQMCLMPWWHDTKKSGKIGKETRASYIRLLYIAHIHQPTHLPWQPLFYKTRPSNRRGRLSAVRGIHVLPLWQEWNQKLMLCYEAWQVGILSKCM